MQSGTMNKKKENLVTITSKKRKYIGIHLTKGAKALYIKNYKQSFKEIKDLNKGKDIPYSWIGRLL